jgi:hypothetical protein
LNFQDIWITKLPWVKAMLGQMARWW